MAKYLINGSTYEIPDDVQGDQLTKTLEHLSEQAQAPAQASQAVPQDNVKKFLDFLGKAEGANYDVIVGGKKFNDFSKHPGVVGLTTKEGPSTAAGKYQITKTTYSEFAPKLGITDFSPESQDKIALAIIEKHGVLDAVKSGDFQTAIGKLGGRWASLPSSPYSQPKRSQDWVQKELGTTPAAPSSAAPTASPEVSPTGYKPFAKVKEKVDPKTLYQDQDWLQASRQMYRMRERKEFEGAEADLADWGKDFMGNFNFNLVDMGRYAASLHSAPQEDKEAFLYMMDTYDNTEWTGEGAWRGFKGLATDPTTYVGLGTLGIGTAGKVAAQVALKQGIKEMVKKAAGRTGVIAGIEGGIYGATDNSIRQSVEVSAGRKESISGTELAIATGVSATGGLVLGTAGDVAAQKIVGLVRGSRKSNTPVPQPTGQPRVDPAVNPDVVPGSPLDAAGTPQPLSGTILTADEIAAATARKQKGRLPEDDAVPELSPDAPDLVVPELNTGLRNTPQSIDEIETLGEGIASQLRGMDNRDMSQAVEKARRASRSLEEHKAISMGFTIYAKEVKLQIAELAKLRDLHPDSAKFAEWGDEIKALEARESALLADDAYGSFAGSLLNQRKYGLGEAQGVTIESLMADQALSRADAENTYMRLVEASRNTVEAQKIARTYDGQIVNAMADGDMQKVTRLSVMKWRELEAIADNNLKTPAGYMDKINEAAISNVFSPTTIAVNLVPSALKTLAIPVARALVTDPLEKATRVRMTASYAAMKSAFPMALRAAKASYKYEQSLLTRDSGRLMDGELSISGRKGGIIRFFPRILNATDEFLGQINYHSYLAGEAAAKAAISGAEAGLKGKALNDRIAKASKDAIEEAYKPSSGEELIKPIVNKGVNLGLTGEDLIKFVEREAVKDPEVLRHGSDKEALDFVRDVLYKRRFSGDNKILGINVSQGAVSYEEAVSKIPAMKFVLGQLFFRTPIRVFEEGVRLTPGLQVIAPGFVDDLAGKNGVNRQARAQGEALASLAIAGAVLTMYAEGRVKGDGAYNDWKQSRHREDSAMPGAYTLEMEDGSTWSFRGFDPIATPVKMMLNSLERLDRLAIREAQGELIDKSQWDKALAGITVGTGAIASALRDANLVAGLDGTIKAGEMFFDPEEKEGAMLKYMGERLKLLVPNTLHKIAKENDPTIKDPATFWQVVESRLFGLGGEDIKSSKAYDVLGDARRPADTGTLWNIFSVATPEERTRGKSEEAQVVMQELDRLSKVTGAVFAPPLKHRMTGDFDLRTVMTSDGTETLYDRWQTNFRALKPEQYLYPIVTTEMPDGTFKHRGVRVDAVNEVLGQLREAAFMQMLTEERRVFDELIKQHTNKAYAKAGLFDYK